VIEAKLVLKKSQPKAVKWPKLNEQTQQSAGNR
jgi:hypothetical protein